MKIEKLGRWAFVIGIFISIISGFLLNFISLGWIMFLLFLLGFLVGTFNINEEKIQLFLLGIIALVVFGLAGIEVTSVFIKNLEEYTPFGVSLTLYSEAFLRTFIVFMASAGIVVANKAIFLASDTPTFFNHLAKKLSF